MTRSIWRAATALLTGLAALTLSACGSDDDPPVTQLRAIHASADTPAVDVYLDGARVAAGATFGQATGFDTIEARPTRVQVTLANQPPASAAIDATLPLARDRNYSVIALGNGASGPTRLQAVVVDDDGVAPGAGQVKLRVVHGGVGVPAVDIFVTAPDAPLPATPTIAALAFGQQAPAAGSAALSVPAGNYRVRARVSGQTDVAFDSGSLALAAGTDAVVVAVPDRGPSVSPIQLLLAPKGTAASFVRDARAGVRVAHLSPNVPAVDVFLKAPGAANSAANRVLQGVTFPNASGFLSVAPGTYDAAASLSGTLASAIELNGATLARGTSSTVFAIGLLGGSGAQALRLAAYPDDRAPVAGQAKVRVIHLAPDAPAVDVVVLNGSAIAARPVQNLAYPNATPTSLVLSPGTYTLGVTAAGSDTVIASQNVTLAAGDVTSILAAGCLSVSGACTGGQPFQFKALDDR